jgi:CheY-like chemotaxis protein
MKKILVIDDEEDIRIVLQQVLELEGYEVAVAADGREGLAILDQDGADLVITDVIMPGMDGVETLEHIREKWSDMPVIVISGGGNVAPMEYQPGAIATNAYLESARQAGAALSITKPFERKELVDAVGSLLSQ